MADRPAQFYYHEQAFQNAFAGTNAKILITQEGNVYKNSILPQNLVVDYLGNVGDAGKVIPGTILIQGNKQEANGDTYAVYARLGTETHWEEVKGGNKKDLKEWTHVTLAVDNVFKMIRLYIDGELKDTHILIEQYNFLNPSIVETYLGASTNPALSQFNLTGSIDDFRIYDKEIGQNKNYFEIHNVELSSSKEFVASPAILAKLKVGQFFYCVDSAVYHLELMPLGTYITELHVEDGYGVLSATNQDAGEYTPDTIRVYNSDPIADEALAVKDIYDFGNQNLNFDEKIFIPPKNVSKGRTASFKISSTKPMNIRGIAIEYQDGAIR